MANREKYDFKLICKKCGAEGLAKCSENDYPFMRRLDFKIDKVVGPFLVEKEGPTLEETEVHCKICCIKI